MILMLIIVKTCNYNNNYVDSTAVPLSAMITQQLLLEGSFRMAVVVRAQLPNLDHGGKVCFNAA